MMHIGYHELVHAIAHMLGVHFDSTSPTWLHPFVHIILFWGPMAIAFCALIIFFRWLKRIIWQRSKPKLAEREPNTSGMIGNPYAYILRNSKPDQFALVALGLLAMPVLYMTLELPKLIINDAIDSGHFPFQRFNIEFTQESYLFSLSGLFLAAILINGGMKFWINLYKGKVGERLLRRLRLMIYKRWRSGAGLGRRAEIVPVVTQEVEPIGGFAADAFALPVFQGGTFLTITTFMFMQDAVLGAAALALLPIQLVIIPKLQGRVNRLSRERVAEIRSLGGELGEQSSNPRQSGTFRPVTQSLQRVESIRLKIYRVKFFMKAINNFLSALTPFFFYAIGGYLVIEDRLTLGALVAVLAAYKDFSAPLKELFRYYQVSEDVRIRYHEIIRYLSGQSVAEVPSRESATDPQV